MQMFQQLVGDESLKNVVLVTTHWNKQDKQHKHREDELKAKYWKMMTLHGSRVERHDGSKASAVRLIQSLLAKPPTVIKIVDELVEQGLRWEDTAIGKTIYRELSHRQAIVEENLKAVKHQLSETERKRELDAKKAQKERWELEERHRIAVTERDEKAMQTFKKIAEEMKAEQEKRDKIWREKEAVALSEKIAYEKQHEEMARRQQKLKNKLKNSDDPNAEIVRLWFRYPGYRVFDWLAWAAWAITCVARIVISVLWITVWMSNPALNSLLAVIVVFAPVNVWRTISFTQTFFGSCGPELHGLAWLVVDLVEFVFLEIGPEWQKIPFDGACIVHCGLLVCVGLRYVLNHCQLAT